MAAHGPKMAPKWPQDGPKRPSMAPRCPKMASNGSKIAQRRPKTAPGGRKMVLQDPKMDARWPHGTLQKDTDRAHWKLLPEYAV